MGFDNRDYYSNKPTWRSAMEGWPLPPPGTLGVAVACILMFILQSATGDLGRDRGAMTDWLGLTVVQPQHWLQVWRWVTYQYLHADAMHIFFNLISVFCFMPHLERLWGTKRTLVFYTLGGIAAGVAFAVVSLAIGGQKPIIGASGSALAVLGACALLFPNMTVLLLVFPVPIRVLAMLWALLYVLTVVGSGNLSDACHLGGLVFGVVGPMVGTGFLRDYIARQEAKKRKRAAQQEANLQAAVDAILEKVHQQGMNSLTSKEKYTLKRATELQQERKTGRR